MEPWLNRSELTQILGSQEVPVTFNIDKLSATLTEVVEGWLSDLLEPSYVTTYRTLLTDYGAEYLIEYPADPYPTFTKIQYTNGKTLKQFLAYAVWSIWIKKSNAINTETGIVAKLNPDSERISDRQRTELSIYYQGLAERKALELQRLFVPTNRCESIYSGSGRPTIRKAQRRSPSRLGN